MSRPKEVVEKAASETLEFARKVGLEAAKHVFEDNQSELDRVLAARQRQMKVCEAKWGSPAKIAYNRGFTIGLFAYAEQYANETGVPREEAQNVITDWVATLKGAKG